MRPMPKDPRQPITVELTRTEALALRKAGEDGLRVIEALGLIKNPGTVRSALDKLAAALR